MYLNRRTNSKSAHSLPNFPRRNCDRTLHITSTALCERKNEITILRVARKCVLNSLIDPQTILLGIYTSSNDDKARTQRANFSTNIL